MPELEHPVVDAALATAATLLGMEVVFIGRLTESTFWFGRVHGEFPGVEPGVTSDRADSFCHRMLAGAPPATSDAAVDPHYAGTPIRTKLGITSYVGVPIRRADGVVFGTLCGLDRAHVDVSDTAVAVLRELAEIVRLHMTDELEGAVIRRTPDGWQVTSEPAGDLTSAMVLADLLAGDLAKPSRPARPDGEPDELTRLRITISQLEHALAARVLVEQAIGVLAERHGCAPRAAFERLRRVARGNGVRVHDLARDVVDSVSGAVPLPPELEAGSSIT
jgi:hypothetical protein